MYDQTLVNQASFKILHYDALKIFILIWSSSVNIWRFIFDILYHFLYLNSDELFRLKYLKTWFLFV